jgi:hypothetical protein
MNIATKIQQFQGTHHQLLKHHGRLYQQSLISGVHEQDTQLFAQKHCNLNEISCGENRVEISKLQRRYLIYLCMTVRGVMRSDKPFCRQNDDNKGLN